MVVIPLGSWLARLAPRPLGPCKPSTTHRAQPRTDPVATAACPEGRFAFEGTNRGSEN